MSDRLHKILESKRAMRNHLAALPFARKLELLEKLRDRSRLIAATSLRRQQRLPKRGAPS